MLGLMDWIGAALPASESIAGCAMLDFGQCHVGAIDDSGAQILGCRDLGMDGIRPMWCTAFLLSSLRASLNRLLVKTVESALRLLWSETNACPKVEVMRPRRRPLRVANILVTASVT
jgi:hypothetical protein